jgi:L-fuculose-phosphate aldolase
VRPALPRKAPIHPVHYRELARVGRLLDEKGLICATDGNLSLRDTDGSIVITASGAHKGNLRTGELLRLDPEGRILWGAGTPSSETAMHLAIYAARPDVGAVVHAHPPVATAFATTGTEFDTRIMPETVLAVGPVPLVPYATPGTEDLARALRPHLEGHDAFLLAHHGAVTLGQDLEEALDRMLRLEHTARILLLARLLGGARPLSDEEIRKLRALQGARKPEGRAADEWTKLRRVGTSGSPGELTQVVAEVIMRHLAAEDLS